MPFDWAVYLATLVVSTLVSALLAPRPKDASASSLGDFTVPTAEEGRPVPIVLGTCKCQGPNVVWYGDLNVGDIKKKSSLFKTTTVGHYYSMSMQLVICVGNIESIEDIIVGEKSLKASGVSLPQAYNAAGTTLSFTLMDLFGGDTSEGGLSGFVDIYFGSSTQDPNPYLEQYLGTDVPAWRNIGYVVLRNMYIGTTVYPKNWAFVVRNCPAVTGLDYSKRSINGDYNPAYAIAFLLTLSKELGGLGESSSSLDLTTFQDAGNSLYGEGFGMSLTIDRSQSADSWLSEILHHINGVLYTDPATGLTCLKLIRNDYDPGTIPAFTEDDLMDIPDITMSASPETLNKVVVRYTDRTQDFTVRTAQAQDVGNYWARGEGADIVLDFLAISNPTLAQMIASREMLLLAAPLAKGSCVLNGRAWALRPGSAFKLSIPSMDILNLICRVTNIRYGVLGSGSITVEFAQDAFSVSSLAFTAPNPTEWVDPVGPPQPCSAQMLVETPYWFVGEVRNITALGSPGDSLSTYADIYLRISDSIYINLETLDAMTPSGVVTGLYSAKTAAFDSTGFTISGNNLLYLTGENTSDDGLYRGDNLAIFADTGEIVAWKTATLNGDGSYTISGIIRGVLDTVPADHSLGTRVFFMTAGMSQVNPNNFPADCTTIVKLTPHNIRGVLPLASATMMSLATSSRAWCSYPPGNVKLNGLAYSAWPANTTGDVTLSWSHRNRVSQGVGSTLIPQDTVGSYSLEGLITVEVLIDGVLKRTWSALTGTSQVYTLAQRTSDDANLTKGVAFRITPWLNGRAGIQRVTPTFVMS